MTTITLRPEVEGLSPPAMTAPLPGCVTIDSTKPDGYLDAARKGTPTAGGNGSTAVAVANLKGCETGKSTPAPACIVGHGHYGIIGTGAGQSPGTTDQHMDTSNEASWSGEIAKLKGLVTDLYLYGCHTGASDVGAQLLYDMAKLANANVYAPTGIIYCDSVTGSFTLELGSQWQIATPTTKPQPINPPVVSTSPTMDEARVHHLGNQLLIAMDQLSASRYQASYAATAMTDQNAMALTQEVLWDQPFTPQGEPGAMITGHLQVVFGHGPRALLKSFLVYNDTLLRDEDNPSIFYRASTRFRDLVQRK